MSLTTVQPGDELVLLTDYDTKKTIVKVDKVTKTKIILENNSGLGYDYRKKDGYPIGWKGGSWQSKPLLIWLPEEELELEKQKLKQVIERTKLISKLQRFDWNTADEQQLEAISKILNL
ncbi:hypothetical protein H6G80_35560 [Nostoc sp. FACHB-87]|uniref:hypothetical protein n=1 Tax=Nostocaceae TaxID=1162 RepID=UPI0016859454|nr:MULTISPECIES: hypothetical protein [Nostocaceae]MBD2459334.1 hypothetical protein [Nostoc sp. FACHB-87]MBD2480335.1 hypothetical protein [Anabaena sp. FACHB-83]